MLPLSYKGIQGTQISEITEFFLLNGLEFTDVVKPDFWNIRLSRARDTFLATEIKVTFGTVQKIRRTTKDLVRRLRLGTISCTDTPNTLASVNSW